MKYIIGIISIFSLISIRIAYADVSINEIAWMGTLNSTYEEWIEFYNSGTEPVSIKNWKIFKKNSSGADVLLFEVKNDIIVSPGGYAIICRTTNSLPNPLNGICDMKTSFGGSGLNNTKEILTLKNENNETIEILQSGNEWSLLGGKSASKETAQKTFTGNWITAPATPKSENAQTGTDPSTNTDGGSGGGGGGGGSSSSDDELDSSEDKFGKEDQVIEVKKNPVYSARMVLPTVFVQHVPMSFDTLVTRDKIVTTLKGKFEWSMGDGGYILQQKSEPFTYTYQEPGEYIISLRYYSSIFNEEPDTIHRKTITVLPADLEIQHTSTGTIRITNNTSGVIDVGEWKLWRNNVVIKIPKHTFVSAGKTLSIPYHVHNFDPFSGDVFLLSPTDVIIASTKKNSGSQQMNSREYTQMKISELFTHEQSEVLYREMEPVVKGGSEKDSTIRNPWIIYSIIGIIICTAGFTIFTYWNNENEKNEKM